MKKYEYKTLENVLERMIKSTTSKLEYPAYGNYCPSKETFLLALHVAILEGKIKITPLPLNSL